jgi:PAS domain-containing protein
MPGNLPMSSLTEATVETITQPLLVLDRELRVEAANRAFLQHFEVEPAETLGTRPERSICATLYRPELEAVGAENGRNFTFEGPLVPPRIHVLRRARGCP